MYNLLRNNIRIRLIYYHLKRVLIGFKLQLFYEDTIKSISHILPFYKPYRNRINMKPFIVFSSSAGYCYRFDADVCDY